MWRAALRLRHAAPCATLAAVTRCDDDTLQKRTTWKASSDKLGPPRVHRIVITGGPCAGKTTAMAKLSLRLQNMGFDVFVVPEVRDAARKGASIWHLRHLHESSPSDEVVGGFSFDFETFRTTSGPSRRVGENAVAATPS